MASNDTVSANSIKFGNEFELDPGAYELRKAGRSIRIGRIPMELLLLLVERRGQLVIREEIVERIWAKAFSSTPTTASTPPFAGSGRRWKMIPNSRGLSRR